MLFQRLVVQVQPIVLVYSTDISAGADIGEAEQIDPLVGNRLGPLAEARLAADAPIRRSSQVNNRST
jgi:hypothetical protein